MRTLMIIAVLISWAQTAGAGEDKSRSWRLRCAAHASTSFTVEFNAARRGQIDNMHAAMVRQGTIKSTDFCAVSIRY